MNFPNSQFSPKSIPSNVSPLEDVAELDWFRNNILRSAPGSEEGFPLSRMMPNCFQKYARIFHPAYVRSNRSLISWAEVSRHAGTTVHPLMQFRNICGLTEPNQALPEFREPPVGRAPEETLYELHRVFARLHRQSGADHLSCLGRICPPEHEETGRTRDSGWIPELPGLCRPHLGHSRIRRRGPGYDRAEHLVAFHAWMVCKYRHRFGFHLYRGHGRTCGHSC